MPAEWSRHQGTWFSWLHNQKTWSTYLEEAEKNLAEAVIALSEGEEVHINALSQEHKDHVQDLLSPRANPHNLRFHLIPTDDSWCRDHGAIFVYEGNERTALSWGFNAWGGKYSPWDHDANASRLMGEALRDRVIEPGIILEGGSIEINGEGLLLTTESCLLNPNRNPGLARGEIEHKLKEYLGVKKVLWLKSGIAGDDTDGHIDDLSRFVNASTILTARTPDQNDPDYAPLEENYRRLLEMTDQRGVRLEIVSLPMPAPVYAEGERLPASYANFYIGNEVVLVPVFRVPQDQVALELIASYFPGRKIIPIDCRAIIWGLGSLHCLSQQIPVKHSETKIN
ncbi:MAG: agmatine deiminase family protein [Candidatus Caenarcaniphilales bacterium]|nr:agmatine deiminase family protein [Candidatus Caenarcaniphilales bacterium]